MFEPRAVEEYNSSKLISSKGSQRGVRPTDHCPYVRPFPADFAGCPAFEPVGFNPVTSDYQPLELATTCRHLTSRQVSGESGRWYPACRLGDAAARVAWRAQATADLDVPLA